VGVKNVNIEFLHALSLKAKKKIFHTRHDTSLLCIIHVRGHKQQASAGEIIYFKEQNVRERECGGAFTEKGTSPALARSLDAASRFLCTLSAHNFTPVLYAAPVALFPSRADKGPEKCVSLYKQMRVQQVRSSTTVFIQKRTPMHISSSMYQSDKGSHVVFSSTKPSANRTTDVIVRHAAFAPNETAALICLSPNWLKNLSLTVGKSHYSQFALEKAMDGLNIFVSLLMNPQFLQHGLCLDA
jgi:hypothetical protein